MRALAASTPAGRRCPDRVPQAARRATGARDDIRERRAPGARSDDGNMIEHSQPDFVHSKCPAGGAVVQRARPAAGSRIGCRAASGARAARIERIGQSEREAFRAGPCDHRAVVGAEFAAAARPARCRSRTRCDAARARIDLFAATPPAATSAVGAPKRSLEHLHAGAQPVRDHVDHGLLERCAQIARRRRSLSGAILLGFEPQRGLQARERESRRAAGRASDAAARSARHCPARRSRSTCGPPG